MRVECITSGPVATNTYILFIDNQCLVIDPTKDISGDISHLSSIIGDSEVLAIWLTHGHYDHILAVNDMYEKYRCPIYISKIDAPLLLNPSLNCSSTTIHRVTVDVPFQTFEKDSICSGPFQARIFETPGHTAGLVTFVFNQKDAFCGDFIFKGSIGRTDLFSGDQEIMESSLKQFKEKMSQEVVLYPGHGPITTLKEEIQNNPFLM